MLHSLSGSCYNCSFLKFSQFVCIGISYLCKMGNFSGNNRPHTLTATKKCLVNGTIKSENLFNNRICLADKFWIVAVWRQFIHKAWQQLANRRCIGINTLHSIYDFTLAVYYNKVCISAHKFSGDININCVTHFAGSCKSEHNDSFTLYAGGAHKAGPCQIFAQKHTERRRCLRIFKTFVCQTQSGRTTAGREQQFCIAISFSHMEHYLVFGRLVYLVNSATLQCFVQFGRQK